MRNRWSREKVLFLLASALCIWMMLKLGLYLSRRPAAPPTPMVNATSVHRGDGDLRGALAPADLATYLGRGSADPFGGPLVPRQAARDHDAGQDRPGQGGNEGKGGGQDGERGGEDGDQKGKEGGEGGDHKGGGGGQGGDGKGNGNNGGKERDDIPKPPNAPPFSLVAVVRTDEPQPRTQAILRDNRTGQLHRVCVGALLLQQFQEFGVDDIRDDSVVLTDARGVRHVLRGRFPVQYGP